MPDREYSPNHPETSASRVVPTRPFWPIFTSLPSKTPFPPSSEPANSFTSSSAPRLSPNLVHPLVRQNPAATTEPKIALGLRKAFGQEGAGSRALRALRRAQHDIDLRPELYTHYYKKEFPERFHGVMDTRRWGPGERIVFEPYSKEIFENTFRWVEEREIFQNASMGHGVYEDAIFTVAAE